MKQIILVVLILITVYPASLILPWWISGIICFVLCYLLKPGYFTSFSASLLTVFVIWYGKAYISDSNFDVPVSQLLGKLMGNISASNVFLLTGLIGGLSSGMAGLLGHWTRTIVSKT